MKKRFISLLLCLLLCLSLAPTGALAEDECTHKTEAGVSTWEDNGDGTRRCSQCEETCDHTSASGNTNPTSCTEETTCSVCGATVSATRHDWSDHNGYCKNCSEQCTHPERKDNCVCATCGATVHNWKNGVCADCRTPCTHSWYGGLCCICGIDCPHESWTNGECDDCHTECQHSEWNDEKEQFLYFYSDGVCTICGMPCQHDYGGDGVCTICGMNEPEPEPEPTPAPTATPAPHTHSYSATVTSAATCTATGVRTYTCSCGASYTESIAATGHSYTVSGSDATCVRPGTKTYSCTVCGDSYTETIPATGEHDYVLESVPGSEIRYRCTVCGNAIPASEFHGLSTPNLINAEGLSGTSVGAVPMEDGSKLVLICQTESDSRKSDEFTVSAPDGIGGLLYEVTDDDTGETLRTVAFDSGDTTVNTLNIHSAPTDYAEGGTSYKVGVNGKTLVAKDISASSENGVSTLSVVSNYGARLSIEQTDTAQYGYTLEQASDGTTCASVGAVVKGDNKTLITGSLLFVTESNGLIVYGTTSEQSEGTNGGNNVVEEYRDLTRFDISTYGTKDSSEATDNREWMSVGEFLENGYSTNLDSTVNFMELGTEYNGQEYTITYMSSTSDESGGLAINDLDSGAQGYQETLAEALGEDETQSTPEPTSTPEPDEEETGEEENTGWVEIVFSTKELSEPEPEPTITLFQDEPEPTITQFQDELEPTITQFVTPTPTPDVDFHRIIDYTPTPEPTPIPTPKVQWQFSEVQEVCPYCGEAYYPSQGHLCEGTWQDVEEDMKRGFKDTVGAVKENGCVPSGTLITLADGTQKPVEELTADDTLLVFDHETGTFTTAGINFIENLGEAEYRVLTLVFADGSETRLIAEHGYFDLDEMQYVYLREDNVADYIGHRFYKAQIVDGEYVAAEAALIAAYVTEEVTGCWETVSTYHLNHYVDGFLSMPGFCEGFFNFFDYDENLAYDTGAMTADIARYGLYAYDNLADYMSYEEFASYPAQYLAVSIGKGSITPERILEMIEQYVKPYRE